MKYSIQCRYSIVEQTFMFIIHSAEEMNQYEFTWLISNVDKPVYILTNNDIVLKAEMEENFVMFSVAESAKPLNEKIVMTKTVPMLVFETDEENLQVIYDYDHIPERKDKFVGKIVHEFLEVAGGGFLQNVDDYNYLERNISFILDDYVRVNKRKSEEKEDKKIAKTTKKEINAEEIKAKTTVKKATTKKNKKSSKKENKK